MIIKLTGLTTTINQKRLRLLARFIHRAESRSNHYDKLETTETLLGLTSQCSSCLTTTINQKRLRRVQFFLHLYLFLSNHYDKLETTETMHAIITFILITGLTTTINQKRLRRLVLNKILLFYRLTTTINQKRLRLFN